MFNNITIKAKLLAAFLFLAALTASISIYLELNLEDVHNRSEALYENGAVPLGLLVKTAEQSQEARLKVMQWMRARTAAERDVIRGKFDDVNSSLKITIDKQFKLTNSEANKTQLRNLQAAIDNYSKEAHNFMRSEKKLCSNSGMVLDTVPPMLANAAENLLKNTEAAIDAKTKAVEILARENDAVADKAEAFSKIAIFVVLLISIVFGVYLTFSITNPLKVVVSGLSEMKSGNLTVRTNLNRGDELGVLAAAIDSLADELQRIMKILIEDSNATANASEELSAVSKQLAGNIEDTISCSNTVASATEQMSVNINAMASGAEQASASASDVASTAEEMSVNMNTIAAAIEEMSASINEIASNTSEVHSIAKEATNKSTEATSVMGKLGEAAKEIGQVTDVIKKIADKTNLLALNATIEAASAGESGKGFAVVAGEIKELANQSAQSAGDITQRIDSIQSETNDAVKVIVDVSKTIENINNSVKIIATHVEQQTKASNEIANNVAQANTGAKRVAGAIGEVAKGSGDVSRNASEAAKGANNVSDNASKMSSVARDNTKGAHQVNQCASDLAKIAGELKSTASKFRV